MGKYNIIALVVIILAILASLVIWKGVEAGKEIAMLNVCQTTLMGDDNIKPEQVIDRCLDKIKHK